MLYAFLSIAGLLHPKLQTFSGSPSIAAYSLRTECNGRKKERLQEERTRDGGVKKSNNKKKKQSGMKRTAKNNSHGLKPTPRTSPNKTGVWNMPETGARSLDITTAKHGKDPMSCLLHLYGNVVR
jgi:hypothetical protein